MLDSLLALKIKHEGKSRQAAQIADAISRLEKIKYDDEDALDPGFDYSRREAFVDSRRGGIERKWGILALSDLDSFEEHFLLYHPVPEIAERRRAPILAYYREKYPQPSP